MWSRQQPDWNVTLELVLPDQGQPDGANYRLSRRSRYKVQSSAGDSESYQQCDGRSKRNPFRHTWGCWAGTVMMICFWRWYNASSLDAVSNMNLTPHLKSCWANLFYLSDIFRPSCTKTKFLPVVMKYCFLSNFRVQHMEQVHSETKQYSTQNF